MKCLTFRSRYIRDILGAIAVALIANQPVEGADITIAAPGTGRSGNVSALEPFALEDLMVPSMRYQQVYHASEFTREIPQGGFINALWFVVDQNGRGGGAGYPAVQIDMAVTLREPDQLSTVFSENIGSSDATVYPQGSLEIGFPAPGSLITQPIVLQNPYFYHPDTGNLLLDIRIFSQTLPPHSPNDTAGPMDAEDNLFGPDSVSRVFAYDVNATSGMTDSIGLVTVFRVTPIPEPSTWAMACVAAALAVYTVRRRKRDNDHRQTTSRPKPTAPLNHSTF